MLTQEEGLRQQRDQMVLLSQEVLTLSDRQDQAGSAVMNEVGLLNHRVNEILERLRAPQQTAAVAPVPQPAINTTGSSGEPFRLAAPERYSGDSSSCRPFLVQCSLHFEMNASQFPTPRSKVAFMLSHLTGRAAAWATSEWDRNSPVCLSYESFSVALKKTFDHSTPGREAARALKSLVQGRRRVSDYAVEFRTLSGDSGWNEPALIDAFLEGLSETLKDQMAPLEMPGDLDGVIALAVRIDGRLQERWRQRQRPPASSTWHEGRSQFQRPEMATPPVPVPEDEAMQLGRTKLSLEEKQRRRREGLCLYCGLPGHMAKLCTLKDQAHQLRGSR